MSAQIIAMSFRNVNNIANNSFKDSIQWKPRYEVQKYTYKKTK